MNMTSRQQDILERLGEAARERDRLEQLAREVGTQHGAGHVDLELKQVQLRITGLERDLQQLGVPEVDLETAQAWRDQAAAEVAEQRSALRTADVPVTVDDVERDLITLGVAEAICQAREGLVDVLQRRAETERQRVAELTDPDPEDRAHFALLERREVEL